MDTTFVTILLVVFLVIAGLAIDVGYMYIGEEELQHSAETSAVAGAQVLKQRILAQIQKNPGKLVDVIHDPVQASARAAAMEMASGKHEATALVGLANDNSNALGSDNDLTVGFWNFSSHTYTPGGKPVNALQVRARRTAESDIVGMGNIGKFISKLSGIDSHNFTPVAIAAIPPTVRANIALATDVCDRGCVYPNICSIPERKLIRGSWEKGQSSPAVNRFVYSSLSYQVTEANPMTNLICNDSPAQDVCGKPIYLSLGKNDDVLRDLEAVMYNPELDKANKEFDVTTDTISGWWIIVPMTDSSPQQASAIFEFQKTTRYALVRVSRICASGPTGCNQGGKGFDSPAGKCGPGAENAIYIDRISCVGCGSTAMLQLPGLQPVLVK